MKTRLCGISFVIALLALAIPVAALAHEHRVYQIGGKEYVFTVGFLNEPVAVDDRAGFSLAVSMSKKVGGDTDHHDEDSDAEGAPVTELEKTLKVEVSAGSVKKIMDLKAVRETPGSYEAVFYPSVQTTYTFRIFGTINATPIDLVFSCNSSDTVSDDMMEKVVSDSVTQKAKKSGFGCPVSKAESTFPPVKTTFSELEERVQGIEFAQNTTQDEVASTGSKAVIAIVLGVFG
ncbi:MAG: hypothetical protein U1A26_01980, partial [Candidatus Sungbacteria bacterium]|nr:hypothetical protein [Candidatus Sungbacteria bacterium]